MVRIVDVRTKSDVYSRPVVKKYPLEDRFVDEVPQGGGNVEDKIHKKDIKIKNKHYIIYKNMMSFSVLYNFII